MRKLLALAFLALALAGGVAASSSSPAQASCAGEYTRCVAHSRGVQWTITNGQTSQQNCVYWTKRCTGDPDATATYYSSAVLICAPYNRC